MINLKDYLQTLVYVPVSVGKETPEDGYYFIIAKNKHTGGIEDACEYHDGDFYMSEDRGHPSRVEKIDSWLKLKEQSYLLSAEELKTLLGEAFDAGFKKSGENFIDHIIEIPNPAPDKQTFLNNLKID